MSWPFLDHPSSIAIAHRGGDTEGPENTLVAFQAAADLGYTHLETDVHRTADGVLIAFHDADLQRMTGTPGTVADRTWADLCAIDLGGGHRIPTLDELLEALPDAFFNIDPKADDAVEPLGDALARHGAIDRVCIGSFSDDRISRLRRRLGPRLCTAPGPKGIARVLAAARGLAPRKLPYGCIQVPPRFGPVTLTAPLVTRVQGLGLAVHVWTINDEQTMHDLLDAGVDGVMTDKVRVLLDVLRSRDRWPPPSES